MHAAGIFAAASGAASGARTTPTPFDPSTTLAWAVPLIVIAPLIAFILAVSSIRTRRSASNMAMFGAFVMLALTVLAAWGLTKRSSPFFASYNYFTLSTAFSGPSNFQTFEIDITLRVDHVTIVALLVMELCAIGVIGWHQVMGRSEPGAARFHAMISLLLFAFAGVLVSSDLAELYAFWGGAGALTFLLLGHRWGLDEPSRRARVAFALPFATDLSLLCGIGWLYARYGAQNLGSLLPILHTNPGWTVRSLVVASVLLFIGVAGRIGMWPLQSWITRTATTAPTAASALAQSMWAIVGVVVLYRLGPIFAASNLQTMQWITVAAAVSAIVAALLALLGNEPRRAVALAGIAATAVAAGLVVHGFEARSPLYAAAGIACVLAVAPARAAAVLAVSAIAGSMRTDDMSEMGEAWLRMRSSSLALLLSGAVIATSACGALAFGVSTRSAIGVALGEAVLLVAVSMLRVFFAVSFGPLRRRRAFEPDRVREAASSSLGWPFLLAIVGLAMVVAGFIRGWLDLLDQYKHPTPSVAAYVIWSAVAVVGVALAAAAYTRNKEGALAASRLGGAWLAAMTARGASLTDRFVIGPSTDVARRFGDWVPAGDSALGRLAGRSGGLATAAARTPALPLVVFAAVVLALALALGAQGVLR